MNNLLFTVLLIILIYYFFYYLPQQKKTKPLTPSQFTQTEPTQIIEKDKQELDELNQKNQALIKENKDYQQKVKDQDTQLTQLQTQIRELAKRPLKPTNSKGIQTDDKSLTNTLDTLIKDIQDLNNSL